MKIEEIKTIVELMSEHDLTEFKIESADMTLCLKRGSQQPVPVMAPAVIPAASPMVTAAAPAAVSGAAPVASAPAAAPASAPAPVDAAKVIESPIVGTFYRSSAPGAEPMVKVGSKVDADTTVCIIEAMKVMNEIKAEKSGTIKEILVENGQPVEYGQALFVLE